MAVATDQAPVHPVFTGWRGGLLAVFCMFMTLYSVLLSADLLRVYGVLGSEISGERGFWIGPDRSRPHWYVVGPVDPQNPASAAGIVTGDRVKFDWPWMGYQNLRAGQSMPLTVEHNGKTRHLDLTVQPMNFVWMEKSAATALLQTVFSLASLLLGIMVLWRGWGKFSALALGLGVIAFANNEQISSFASSAGTVIYEIMISSLCGMISFFILAVPTILYSENKGIVKPYWKLVFLFIFGARGFFDLIDAGYKIGLFDYRSSQYSLYLAYFSALIAAYWCWRGSVDIREGKDKFRTILLGFAVVVISNVALNIVNSFGLATDGISTAKNPLIFALAVCYQSFPYFLAWAVLRHKAIDLGFAINRTLVFGTISFVMLAAFGLLEWATHHLLPEEWAKGSAWVDGGIALALFLVFHRVRDWVEHRVEHWFFHDWQVNEATLRRFIASAAHFEHRDALVRAFGAELQRFCGVPAAVYLRDGAAMALAAGEWAEAPPAFAADDPAFALLRAERRPLDLTETQTDLPGVLALPMLDHGVLTGVALLPAKADGSFYRPDEVEVLGWAALQVGLDIAALRARHLEVENQRLATRVETLAGLLRPAAPAP